MNEKDKARFWAKVNKTADNGCWVWTANKTFDGYAKFWHQGRLQYAHRVLYESKVGTVPDGYQLDHLCRHRGCVNPQHLEVVTPSENARRGTGFVAQQAAQTHCKHGHPFNDENTYHWRNHRFCRTCRQNVERRRKRKRKQKEHA